MIGGSSPTCSFQRNPQDGKYFFPASGEWFDNVYRTSSEHWCNSTAGVTLVGFSADRSHLFMGVSTAGMTVEQVAQWLKDRGAYEVLQAR